MDETFTVKLTDPVNATLAGATATATIRDDDDQPGLSVANATGTEGSTAEFVVSLDGSSAQTVKVDYDTSSGTARESADFTAKSGTLTLAPGARQATISVQLTDDTLDESAETFSVVLDSPVGAKIVTGTATGTITDNDSEPTVSVSDATGTEGGNADFVVELSTASGRDVTVDYATSDGTAVGGSDFIDASGTLTIAAGAVRGTISVSLTDDAQDEENETFSLELTSPSNATVLDGSATGSIVDNDDPPTLAVSAAAADEGDAVAFVVTLDATTSLTVTVVYGTSSGTAGEPDDFEAVSGMLTFMPGNNRRTVSVSTAEDSLDEPDEEFTFALSSPSNATLGTAAANGTIRDDDDAPTLAVTDAGGDEGGIAAFEVSLSVLSGREVTVTYDALDGTATAGADFQATAGTLTFAPGTRAITVEVPLTDDEIDETDETFELRLASPAHATFGDRVGRGTIRDNDDPPALSLANAEAAEGEVAAFAVKLTAASGLEVSVSYATSAGTAQAPADFAATSGVLTFPPGTVERTISVPIADDALDEVQETFDLALSTPVNATVSTGTATGTIEDNDDAPLVSVADAFAEEGESVEFIVELSAASGRTVRVSYGTADDSAVATADYESVTGELTFAPGTTRGTVSVTLIEDELDEPEEVFTLSLSAPVNAAVQGTGSAEGRIIDNDGAPQLAIGNATATEGDQAVFEVMLVGTSSQEIAVNYATRDVSAREGVDYEAAEGTLTFAAETASRTISIALTDDTVAESDETFEVTLSSPVNATLATSVATGTIRDDDAAPTLSVSDAVGEEGGVAAFAISLAGTTSRTVTVRYATLGGTAREGTDFDPAAASLTFPPGERSRTVTVALKDDSVHESDETFFLQLQSPVNATVVTDRATGTIRDNDAAPTLSVTGASGEEGGTLAFEVVLSGATDEAAMVDYATADGTARDGLDYEATSGSLRFAPGTSHRTISVDTNDDELHDPDETFRLTLSSPVNATLRSDVAEGRIVDNDGAPTVSIADAEGTEGETVRFRVTLTGSGSGSVTVDFATMEGTAEAGTDYRETEGTLTFDPGESVEEIPVRLLQDALGEPDERFEVRLSSPTNATVTNANATGTIYDDDGGIPTLSVAHATAIEGETLAFALSLDRPAGSIVSIDYRTANGTAFAGTDYAAAAGTLTIGAGEKTGTVEVQTLDDDAKELEEQLSLHLSSATNANLISGVVTGTILDNDVPPELAVEGDVTVEGEPARFTVTLTGAVTERVTVDFAAVAVTALADADFEPVRGTLTFDTGIAVVVPVPTIDDDIDEPVEIIELSLTAPVNAELPVDSAISTIEDNDAPPALSISDASGVEGEVARFLVALSDPSGFEVAVAYSTADGTAMAGADYEAVEGSIAFAPGETMATVSIPLIQDDLDEPDEGFTVTLSDPANATLATGTAEGLIIDDDIVTQLAVAGGTGVEGGTVEFSVTLDTLSSQTVSVDYATAAVSAHEDEDYKAVQGSLTFLPGESAKTVAVTLVDDDVHEDDEVFTLDLSMAENAGISTASATGTIFDDDAPPELSITGGAAPEGGMIGFTVTLTGATSRTATVDYSTVDGTATAGDDYVAAAGTLTFMPGETAATFAVTTADDDAYEPDESFEAVLSSPLHATLATRAATGTILDDDEEPATLSARPADPMLCVGGDPVEIDLAQYFGGTSLRYSAASANPAVVTVELRGSVLTVSPVEEGQTTLALSAINGSGEASTEVIATVVTDPAELAAIDGAFARTWSGLLAEIMGGIGDRFVDVAVATSDARPASAPATRSRPDSGAFAGAATREWDRPTTFGGGDTLLQMSGERPRAPDRSPPGAFSLSTGTATGPDAWSVWGRGSLRRHESLGDGDIDGSLEALQIGADRRVSDWILGASAALSRSDTNFSFVRSMDVCGGGGTGDGVLETELASVHPYAGRKVGDGWVWGTLGVGRGEARLKRCVSARQTTTDVSVRMGALGGRHRVGSGGRFELSLVEDIGVLRATTGTAVGPIHDRSVSVGRARVGVEMATLPGSGQVVIVAWGRSLGRHDWGDGVEGTGLEIAAGARLRIPCARFGLDAGVHALAVHSADQHEERGADIAASILPKDDGSGVQLRLAWRRGARNGLDRGTDDWLHDSRWRGTGTRWQRDAYLGYGIAARRMLVQPFVSIGATDGGGQTQSVGLRVDFSDQRRQFRSDISVGRQERSRNAGNFVRIRLDARI